MNNLIKKYKETPWAYVDPLIDSGKPKTRWVFFQSASRPFGMVQLSPDTDTEGTWGVGYRYNSPRIKCFSHLHSWQLGALPMLPYSNEYTDSVSEGYEYSHEDEQVHPGYHRIKLLGCSIDAELSATERVGMHRYTFHDKEKQGILIDLKKQLGPGEMGESQFSATDSGTITGFVDNIPTLRRPKYCRVYFHIEFNKKIEILRELAESKYIVEFREGEPLLVKTALSFVDEDGARINMESEIPHWNFDKVVRESIDEWNRFLGRIEVKGERKKKVKFYTDLWRSSFGGHIINDSDGRYCDMTGDKPAIRQVPLDDRMQPSFRFISNADVFWGAHWSLGLLWDLVYPDIKSDYCKSLVEMYKNGGLIPRGPSGGNYTFVMIASHSTPFIVSAYMKGIRDFDIEEAYEGMKKNAMPGGLMSKSGYEHNSCLDGGIEFFIERGYIPERERKSKGIHCDGAAMTLEYSYDHWCIAQLAKVLGRDNDFAYFHEKSKNYRNIWDESTGFMRPRNLDGSFIEPFDPLSLEGFCEGNGWGYSFYVPQDIPGLIKLMGGEDKFIGKLQSAFEKAGSMKYYAAKPELRRNEAYINYGNENTRFHAALFSHAGRPDLSNYWSRKVHSELFSGTGLSCFCEDDDNGLSAGTSLLLSMGLFDVRGGAYEEPVYEIGSPVFDEIHIKLDDKYYSGNTLSIIAANNSEKNTKIGSINFNDRNVDGFTLKHDDIINGGVIELRMESNQ